MPMLLTLETARYEGMPKKLSRENNSSTQIGLGQIRDLSPVSSRNTTKGALVKETYAVFKAVNGGLPLTEVKQAILRGEVFQKASYETRRNIKDLINHRYLAVCPEWIGTALAKASEKGAISPEFLSLAYLYFVLRDRLVFDFVTNFIWQRWVSQSTSIHHADFLAVLEQQAEESPQIRKWKESTRDRLVSSDLAALRDFGLLKGIQKKYIQRPTIAAETVFHLLCILMAEGLEGKALLDAPDWRIFLWSEADVVNGLSDLAQRRWINFEKIGRTVILNLVRQPEIRGDLP